MDTFGHDFNICPSIFYIVSFNMICLVSLGFLLRKLIFGVVGVFLSPNNFTPLAFVYSVWLQRWVIFGSHGLVGAK